jgi:glutaminase
VMTPYAISRTLSVMTSSGMYDYAGEWIYRVGIPAKSGVGGGILAALPARLGPRQLLPEARQARQQCARHQGLRGAVLAL